MQPKQLLRNRDTKARHKPNDALSIRGKEEIPCSEMDGTICNHQKTKALLNCESPAIPLVREGDLPIIWYTINRLLARYPVHPKFSGYITV